MWTICVYVLHTPLLIVFIKVYDTLCWILEYWIESYYMDIPLLHGCMVASHSVVVSSWYRHLVVSVRVRVNSSVRRAGRDRVRVSNQDVVETGYALRGRAHFYIKIPQVWIYLFDTTCGNLLRRIYHGWRFSCLEWESLFKDSYHGWCFQNMAQLHRSTRFRCHIVDKEFHLYRLHHLQQIMSLRKRGSK